MPGTLVHCVCAPLRSRARHAAPRMLRRRPHRCSQGVEIHERRAERALAVDGVMPNGRNTNAEAGTAASESLRVPTATAPFADRMQRTPDGRFARGNTVARSKRLRPGPRGMAGHEDVAPEFRPFARWGNRYAARRREELARPYVAVSHGVGALIDSAAMAMAGARFLFWRAAQFADPEALHSASRLAEQARHHELAALDLASREAELGVAAPPPGSLSAITSRLESLPGRRLGER